MYAKCKTVIHYTKQGKYKTILHYTQNKPKPNSNSARALQAVGAVDALPSSKGIGSHAMSSLLALRRLLEGSNVKTEAHVD